MRLRILCLLLPALNATVAPAAPAPAFERARRTATHARQALDLLAQTVAARQLALRNGQATVEEVLALSDRLFCAELGLATTSEQRITAHVHHRDVTRKTAMIAQARYSAGKLTWKDNDRACSTLEQAQTAVHLLTRNWLESNDPVLSVDW
jgi:hypothetical protein